MRICMESICHYGKLEEDIIPLVLIYLKDIFEPRF